MINWIKLIIIMVIGLVAGAGVQTHRCLASGEFYFAGTYYECSVKGDKQ